MASVLKADHFRLRSCPVSMASVLKVDQFAIRGYGGQHTGAVGGLELGDPV